MFSIGEISKSTGMKIPTIRYYEQKGLLNPPDRTHGNQRRYSKHDREQLNFIKHARQLGLNLASIKELIGLSQNIDHSCEDADKIVKTHLESIRTKIIQLQNLEKELTRMVASCKTNTILECNILRALNDHSLCEKEH